MTVPAHVVGLAVAGGAAVFGWLATRGGGAATEDGDRWWSCGGCGRTYGSAPRECEHCGWSVEDRHPSGHGPEVVRGGRDDAGDAGGEGTAPADDGDGSETGAGPGSTWECVQCGSVYDANPRKCRSCGHTIFDWSPGAAAGSTGDVLPGASPSTAVVRAVAEREGVDPTEMAAPLNEAVDPDALDALVAELDAGRVTFEYHGYAVTVSGDGRVTVEAA